jgi:hypothetical protein
MPPYVALLVRVVSTGAIALPYQTYYNGFVPDRIKQL